MIEKCSAGIACARVGDNGLEVLLIKKRFTYAYNTFVNGRYKTNSNYELISLFNAMTLEEKLDILSLNFVQIWYRIWLNNPQKTSSFYIAKSKFDNTFLSDGGSFLRSLMHRSREYGQLVWEIPKGRKKRYESDIQCGIREFNEETLIPKKRYQVFDASYKYSYISDKSKYTNVYYYAFCRDGYRARLNISNGMQVGEVGDIRWMNMNEIKINDPRGQLQPVVRKLFNYVKKKIK